MTNEMQIIDLQPEIMVGNEKWLNTFIQKAEILRKNLDELWEVLTDETYETAKKLRQEITSWKTSVEDARSKIKAPVLELWRQIDSRAKFLSEPFEKMKEEVNAKIYAFEEEDRKRKEAEQKRIDDIVEKINSFENLEELWNYYKSLEVNDQRRKAIMEAWTIRKNQILDNIKKNAIESIKKEIASVNTLEWLETIVVWEYGAEVEIMQALNDRKNKIEFDIAQKKLEEDRKKDRIKDDIKNSIMKISNLEDLEKFKNDFSNEFFELSIFENELNVRKEYLEFQKEKLEKEEKEKLEKEKLDAEKKKMLEDKIEIAVWKIWLFLTVEALDSFYNNDLQEEVKNTDIVKSDYNSKRKSLLQALEIEKKAKIEPVKFEVIPDLEIWIKWNEETPELVEVSIKKDQEKSSVYYCLQKWFETPSTELQLESCIEAIKRTYWIYDNKTEFVTNLRDFILSYNEE